MFLIYGRNGNSEHEHNSICKLQGAISHENNLLEDHRPNPSRDSHLNRWAIPQKRYAWSPLTPCSLLICRSAHSTVSTCTPSPAEVSPRFSRTLPSSNGDAGCSGEHAVAGNG